MKKISIIFLLISLSFAGYAQRVVFEGQYLTISPGFKYSNLYDEAISEKHFPGIMGSVNLAYLNQKNNRRFWFELEGDLGYRNFVKFPKFSSRSANTLNGYYDLGFIVPLHKFSNKLYIWGGPGLSGRYAYNQVVDFVNSQDNYVFTNSIGFNTMLHYTFDFMGRWWSFEWTVNLPVITYYMRPGFAVNWPEGKIGNSELTTLNKFIQVDSKFKLVYPLLNENKIALEYKWNYFDLKDENRVMSGTHGLFVSLYFRLNSN